MISIEKEWKNLIMMWNVEPRVKEARWYGFEIDWEPHYESYSKVGLYVCKYSASNSIYGKFVIGVHYGKYLVEFSLKEGFKFHDNYLNVDENNDDIPNTSPGEYE